MPNLQFYQTVTNLPLDKVRTVTGGYTMVSNCAAHNVSPDPKNPNLTLVTELVIDNKDYPSAQLYPHGYFSADSDAPGDFPKRTIFFYKHFLESFEKMKKEQFDRAPNGAEFMWECGCVIRKFSMEEIEQLCLYPWFPWIGDVELPFMPTSVENPEVVIERKKTKTAEQVVTLLVEEGFIHPECADMAIAVIKKHRKKNRFV